MGFVPSLDLRGKRVLIFVVAYNAETTIEKVLSRIPPSLHQAGVEVLIIDDSSRDETFLNGLRYQQTHSAFKITVLRTPENQGYGGNQKLGYRYAIDNGFDIVALVHGDGQYAPEKLPTLLAPLIAGKADAVFGSRMIDKRAARAIALLGRECSGRCCQLDRPAQRAAGSRRLPDGRLRRLRKAVDVTRARTENRQRRIEPG